MSGARLAVAVCALITAQPALAETPERTATTVGARAEAAGFDGTILIGEPDATFRILSFGQPAIAPDAVWRWASITKQLTAVLVMQEVAAGRLSLDETVARYWPEWRSPIAGQVRIRDLLLHNCGLPQPDETTPDAEGIPAFYRAAAAAPAASAQGFCAQAPRAAPPAPFNYNNCDSIVLGEILARVSGVPFETLIEERIARPLGMREFGMFRVGEAPRAHVAPTGEFSELDPLINLGVNGASGGAYGTIEDLWRFDHALLSGQLLDAGARAQMWESHIDNGFYGFHQWIFPASLAGCPRQMQVVERQGLIGGIELRNYLLPETGQALILFSRHRPSGFGDPWEGKGLAHDMLSAVACPT
jgi:CubicO group peptidase (beta-lactamase class C family)